MKHTFLLIFALFALSGSGQVQLQLAQRAMEDGKFEEALEYFENIYEKEPSKRDIAYRGVVNCYIELSQYDDGYDFIDDHRKAVRQRSEIFYIDMGYMRWLEGDSTSAKSNFESVFEAVRQMPAMAYQYSEKFKEWGLFRFALQTLQVAEQANPQMFFAQQKALLYAEMGNLKMMYDSYLNVLDRNPNFLETYKNILRFNMSRDGVIPQVDDLRRSTVAKIQNGGSEAFNELLVWIFTQEGKYGSAFRQLKALYLRGAGKPYDMLQLANTASQTGAYDDAVDIFEFLYDEGENTPFYADAVYGLTVAKLQRTLEGTPTREEIEQLRTEMIQREEQLAGFSLLADALLIRAELEYLHMKDPEMALATIETVLNSTAPSSQIAAEAKLLKGDIELVTGAPYDAILTYAQVEGDFESGVLGQEARFRKARVAFYTGDFEWAEATFKVLKTSTSKLIANDAMRLSLLIKDNAALDTTYFKLEQYAEVLLLQAQLRYDDALAELDTLDNLLSLSTEHPLEDEAIYTRARIFEDQQKWDTAVATYISVVDAFPKDLLADESLIRAARIAQHKLNDLELAKQLYERVLLEHGNSIYAEEARNEFRKLRGDLNT